MSDSSEKVDSCIPPKESTKKIGKGYSYLIIFVLLLSLFSHKYDVSYSSRNGDRELLVSPVASEPFNALAIFGVHLLAIVMVLTGDTDKLALFIGRLLTNGRIVMLPSKEEEI